MTQVIVIAAMTFDQVIGLNNKMPWHLPEDLIRFKKLTKGNVVIMGRKTYESLGAPLPQRLNVVISRNATSNLIRTDSSSPLWSNCLIKAIEYGKTHSDKVYIIGGQQIYEQAVSTPNLVNRYELTLVHGNYEGDAFFPSITLPVGHPTFKIEYGSGCSFLSWDVE